MHVCDLCKKKPATVHLTDIHDNVKRELHMCEECAKAKGFSVKQAANLPHLLAAMSKKAAVRRAPKEEDLTCDVCGIAWSEFRAKGRFGCANDYTAFRSRLGPLLAEIHPRGANYGGKLPARTLPDEGTRHEYMDCQRRLREAVEQEQYEEAAKCRDRLAEIRAKMDAR